MYAQSCTNTGHDLRDIDVMGQDFEILARFPRWRSGRSSTLSVNTDLAKDQT